MVFDANASRNPAAVADRQRLDEQLVLDIVTVLGVPQAGMDTWQRTLQQIRPVEATITHRDVADTQLITAPRMPLIDRDQELRTLITLAPGSLALVTGMSGVGKSELTLHACRHWLGLFRIRHLPSSLMSAALTRTGHR